MDLGNVSNSTVSEVNNLWLPGWSFYELLFITLGYLSFILSIGPRYMKNRQPYSLKTFILFYNIFQIVINAWFVKTHISAGWFIHYTSYCMTDLTYVPPIKLKILAQQMLTSRLIDYVETCMFVLRKKENQISFLHVYHHVSNIFLGWLGIHHALFESATIVTLINCSVHVIMYLYYFLTALSPRLQRILNPIKPYITRLQMIQFIVLIVYAVLVMQCEDVQMVPIERRLMPLIFGINVIIIFYLFYDFYKKSYIKVKKPKDN